MYQGVIHDSNLSESKKVSRNALPNTHSRVNKASSLSDCSLSSSTSSTTMSSLKHLKQKPNEPEENKIRRFQQQQHHHQVESDDDQGFDAEESYDELNASSSKYLHPNPYYESIHLPALKCSPFFESPINNSQIQYDCSAPIARNTPENNEVKLIDYRQNKMASFKVDGKELICLPQAFEIFLKNLVGGLHTVYTKLKRLDIVPIICNVEQVNICLYL